jgi:RNA polymerase sigma-70 factor (ECF subfamily)
MSGTAVDAVAEQAFEEIFEAEMTYVWNALRRLGIREADREDLTQEIFVRVHKALPTYDPTRPRRPWLFAFAFRVASDFRRLKRHQVEVRTPSGHEPIATDQELPDEVLEAEMRRQALHRALDTLDLDRRAVIVLHEMEGLPIPEVARTLGIPVGTASSRLRAARAQVKEALMAERRDAS